MHPLHLHSLCVLKHNLLIGLIFFRHCGVRNPSWAELNNFVKFLNIQLSDCEGSVFCNEAIVGDVLQGFKQFVVKFMIRMSRVCCEVTNQCISTVNFPNRILQLPH